MTAQIHTLPSPSYTVYVKARNVYGNELIYPANEWGEKFSLLIGKKTFSRGDIARIEGLGYRVVFA